MAIHNEEIRTVGAGQTKTINEGAMGMILDNLQKYQYLYPIKSTTRELVSNGVDSIADKNVAKKILKGEAQPSDFFVEKEGALYDDSKWDPSYYDLNWLDDKDLVEIRYICGRNMEKDKVIITDTGVGLGGKRLEGFFSLGFSTKRLSKLPLGKWGIGAKSPLSVGVDFYTVESRYNGQLYRFNVYAHTVDSIIPRWDLASGRENEHILWNAGTDHEYQVFWEPTKLKNGVTVTIGAKKAHQQQYIDAVKSQLLYFDHLQFIVVNDQGYEQHIPYKATIVYEDDFIILSDNNYYSKPHLLLNKVNYGYINWEELELEDRQGNIGIKVAPENVDVTPSREGVIWSDRTKAMIHERFEKVQDIASKLIQEELKDTDFLRWVKTCYSIGTRFSDSKGIVSRLAKIVDISNIKPRFNPDPRIEFLQTDILGGIYIRLITLENKTVLNETKLMIVRKEIKGIGANLQLPIYLMEDGERASNKKDKYLLECHPSGFITMTAPPSAGASESAIEQLKIWENKNASKGVTSADIWKFIEVSALPTNYTDVEIPEEFDGTDEDHVERKKSKKNEHNEPQDHYLTKHSIQRNQQKLMTKAERQKMEGKIDIKVWGEHGAYVKEVEIKSINTWSVEEVFYAETGQESECYVAAHLSQIGISNHTDKVRIILPSKKNLKLFLDFEPITKFFININNSQITMSNALIRWNTARLIADKLDHCQFLNNFERFNPRIYDKFVALKSYVDENYKDVGSHRLFGHGTDSYKDLITHLDNVYSFQQFVKGNMSTPDLVAQMALQLFGNKEITDGCAVEISIMEDMLEVTNYSNILGPLLNYIPILSASYPGEQKQSIPEELEREIINYIDLKGLTYEEESSSTESSISQTESVYLSPEATENN